MDSPSTQVPRSQAGPLPTKAGELGYSFPISSVPQNSSNLDLPTLARHPADREAETFHAVSLQDTQAELFVATLPTRKSAELCGVQVFTLFILAIQILVVAGTGVTWYIAIQRLAKVPTSSNAMMTTNTMLIFVHVAFAIAVLIQLIFIERRVYHLRAERYAYTHRKSQVRLDSRNAEAVLAMSYAPWNRPPLPTYASALAQTGCSTGDVEDSHIAIAPPPAYGQTRQTKMLQQGYLRDSLRRARPISVDSMIFQADTRPVSLAGITDREVVHMDQDAVEIRDNAAVVREVERILRSPLERKEPPTR